MEGKRSQWIGVKDVAGRGVAEKGKEQRHGANIP